MSDPSPGSGRMVLLLIGGLPVTIVLAATWLWYFGTSGNVDLVNMLGTANRGQLIQPPRQLDDFALSEDGSEQTGVSYRELEPRWTMVVPNAGPCDTSCEERLYLTRQIHTAMGKEFKRIRRFYVGDSPAQSTSLDVTALSDQRPAPAGPLVDFLDAEHRGLTPLVLPPQALEALFPEVSADPSTWYLVDPSGWVMMAYTSDVPYKDVISDLKFLLKNSSG